MKKLFTLGCSLLILASCHTTPAPQEPPQEDDEPQCSCPELQIALQPYGDFAAKDAEQIKEKLIKEMPYMIYYGSLDISILPAKPLPREAYSEKRGRYRAKDILEAQKKSIKDVADKHYHCTTIIGLTTKDICTYAHNVEDWGIMGLSYRPGNVCVVSSHRVKPHKELWKVVAHEYLHSLGYPHCPAHDPACIMTEAYPVAKLSERKGLCTECGGLQ